MCRGVWFLDRSQKLTQIQVTNSLSNTVLTAAFLIFKSVFTLKSPYLNDGN